MARKKQPATGENTNYKIYYIYREKTKTKMQDIK